MKYFFCLLTHVEASNGVNIGKTFAYANRGRWIQCDDVAAFITVGFNRGNDYVVNDNKAYNILKSYTDLAHKQVVFVCAEDVSGCNI